MYLRWGGGEPGIVLATVGARVRVGRAPPVRRGVPRLWWVARRPAVRRASGFQLPEGAATSVRLPLRLAPVCVLVRRVSGPRLPGREVRRRVSGENAGGLAPRLCLVDR